MSRSAIGAGFFALLLASSEPAHSQQSEQFDLVCDYQNKTTYKYDSNRYKVDLDKMQVCIKTCASFDKIRLEGETLVLSDWEIKSMKLIAIVNRATGAFWSRQTISLGGGSTTTESTGTCKREAYTGPTGKALF